MTTLLVVLLVGYPAAGMVAAILALALDSETMNAAAHEGGPLPLTLGQARLVIAIVIVVTWPYYAWAVVRDWQDGRAA